MARLEELQQAAVQVWSDRGFAATGIREIGQQAGLNSATIYHYASGKEELLVDVMRSCMTELLRAGREAADSTDDPRLQLGRVVAAHVGLCAVNPRTATVTDQELRSLGPDGQAVQIGMRDEYESLVQRVLARGVRTGQFHLGDTRVTRLGLMEMCNGVAHWFRPDGRLSVRAVQRELVALSCRMAGAEELTRAELAHLPAPVRLPCEPATIADLRARGASA